MKNTRLLLLLTIGFFNFANAASVSDSQEFQLGDLELSNVAGDIELTVGEPGKIVVSYESSDDSVISEVVLILILNFLLSAEPILNL